MLCRRRHQPASPNKEDKDDPENDRRHVHRLPPPRPAVTWQQTPPKFEIPKSVQKSQKHLLAKFRQKTKFKKFKNRK
jgi:hypothetical protein